MKRVLILSLFAGAATVSPAFAQTGNTASDPTLEGCRAIGKDSERLKCYDSALDAMYGVDEALETKRAEYRRDRFGLPVDESGMQLTELEATVAEVDENIRTGTTVIALDNGQVWQLTSTGGLRARFRPGLAVIISESGTGGYRIRIPDKTGFKGVNRIR